MAVAKSRAAKDGPAETYTNPLEGLEHPGVPEPKSARDRRATEAMLEAAVLRIISREGVLGGINLREVAAEANVNRGLVYQHFGSRRSLVRAALKALHASRVPLIDSVRGLPLTDRRRLVFRASSAQPAFARIEALLAIDGDDSIVMFPGVTETLAELERDKKAGVVQSSLDIRAVHAMISSVTLGYSIFRDQMARELDLTAEELDAKAEKVLVKMIQGLRSTRARRSDGDPSGSG